MMAVTSHTVCLCSHIPQAGSGVLLGQCGINKHLTNTVTMADNVGNSCCCNADNAAPCLSMNPVISDGYPPSKYTRMKFVLACITGVWIQKVPCSTSLFFSNLNPSLTLMVVLILIERDGLCQSLLHCNPQALFLAPRTVNLCQKCDPWPSYLEEAIPSMDGGFCDLSWLQMAV